MSSNTNLDFVKFVKNKKHAKPDDDELYEIDFLGRKKEGISFNDTNRNDVKKLKIKDGEISLADFLTKNKNKIIEEPKRKENEKNKKEEKKVEKDSEDEDDYSKENDSYNESDDYSEDKINHYIGHKRENVDEMEEIINEIKNRTEGPKKNEEDSNNSDNENSEKDENEDNNEEKKEKEKKSEENEKKERKKKKKEKKKKNKEKKEKKFKKDKK